MHTLENNGYKAKMLLDSISPAGIRLSTMEITFPRIVLAEFNTHRMLSRNSASSRAIPVEKQLKKMKEQPFIPEYWGKNQKGMQADQELEGPDRIAAEARWRKICVDAISAAEDMMKIGLHKQISNRVLEAFSWHTVIVSATEWSNFLSLRCHRDAQPEIRNIAILMRDLLKLSTPRELGYRTWHLPLIQPNEIQDWMAENSGKTYDEVVEMWKKISVGRCARVSYLTHDGRRDLEADIKLCNDLRTSGHMSPFEHAARPMNHKEKELYSSEMHRMQDEGFPFAGNFRGWISYRKEIPHENDYGKIVNHGTI